MNKNFYERIGRLEELAKKATPGPWVNFGYESGNGNIDITVGTKKPGRDICRVASQLGYHNCSWNAAFITAANPAMILEMIAELKRLEKKLNDKKAHIGAQASRIKILEDNLSGLQEAYRKLDKEADWLAGELRSWEYDQALPGDNIPGIKEFRELARKTVSEADNA